MFGDTFWGSKLHKELLELTSKLERWYVIGKVTWYVVYVYGIDDPEVNLFDIWRDEIVMLSDKHVIPVKAAAVIQKIQEKLKENNKYLEGA